MFKLLAIFIPFVVLAFYIDEDVESIDLVLQRKASISIESDSLVGAITAFAEKINQEDTKFAIKIIGKDLQVEGLTINQMIRNLKLADKSVTEILTAIVMKANSMPNVKSPADPQWKLIWVIGPDPDDAERRIVLVTTRAAAKKRGDTLPECFKVKE